MSSYNTYFGSISVKDPSFAGGAVGDNTHDDTAAIQAAFDFAFGTAASPHGNGSPAINPGVFFPPGKYKTTSPLVMTAVWGGKLWGVNAIINSTGAISPVNSEGWCPVLWLNGCNFCIIEGISFAGVTDATNHSTVCIWFGPDGALGGSSAHGNILKNCYTSGASFGVIHGSTNSAANSENTYINCGFGAHEMYGMFVSGANSLNMRLYGCGFGSCGIAGLKTNNAATVPIISNCVTDHNFIDFWIEAGAATMISGTRAESVASIKASSLVTIANFGQAASGGTLTGSTAGSAASFTGSIANVSGTGILTITSAITGTLYSGETLYGTGVTANTRLLYPVVNSVANTGNVQWIINTPQTAASTAMTAGSVLTVTAGTGAAAGQAIYGTQGANSLPSSASRATRVLKQLTGTPTSGTLIISDKGSPADLTSTTLTVRPVWLETVGAASIEAQNSGSGADSVIISDSNGASLSFFSPQILDQIHGGISADLFKWCAAQIVYFDVSSVSAYTVANLPTPLAGMKGLRMFVTDSTVAASTNFGAIVAGSSTNTVPVYCDGTNWRIG